MKTRMVFLPALLALAVIAPADAVSVYSFRYDAANVDARPSTAGSTGVTMFFDKATGLVDSDGWGYPSDRGCVNVFIDGFVDSGCGAFSLEVDGTMGSMTISGAIGSNLYRYYGGSGFGEYLGRSEISVQAVITGTGLPEPLPNPYHEAGICGVPPEPTGPYVGVAPALLRDATMTGVAVSRVAGGVDLDPFPAQLVQALLVQAVWCI